VDNLLTGLIGSKTRIKLLMRFFFNPKTRSYLYYMANTKHVLFPELKSMVSKVMGIDQVIDSIINRLGNLERAYLVDDYAEGKDTGIIDLVLVGDIDHYHLNDLSRKTERYIKRKIRTLVLSRTEFGQYRSRLEIQPHILIWMNGMD
jgi:hypothetical protein